MATLNVNLTVPDAQATAILNDFCEYHGYQEEIADPEGAEGDMIDNPQTKVAFTKAKVAEFVKNSVKSLRANREADLARDEQIAEVDLIDIN